MSRDLATERQVDAADPGGSTWLLANAGSGKTRVLTDRVARLLLAEISPENILCLTYTKAAASEMQNRLFRRLGAWAMLDDARLGSELAALGRDGPFDRVFLQRARTLFARAIETPGGLRIQTIHSFCAGLLRRFPLEAGVSPNFTEVEDRAAQLLRAEILDDMATGPDAPLVGDLVATYSGADSSLDALLLQIVGRKAELSLPPDPALCHARYDVPAGLDSAALLDRVFLGGETALIETLRQRTRDGGPNDAKTSARLAAFPGRCRAALPFLEGIFLTGADAKTPFGAKIDKVPTSGACKKDSALAALMPDLNALMLRLEDTRPLRLRLEAAERDLALHRFAVRFLDRYAAEKQARGWLDFEDLIEKAAALLTDSALADWVLYRLDGGIDHILVDEAQDTARRQWQVIARLAEEFTSGAGARGDRLRTLFVVGDKKQSIYSFQGADAEAFDRMRDTFEAQLADTATPLATRKLEHSFRSAGPILRAVDATFEGREASGFSADQSHIAFHETLPGRVDLWPVVPKPDAPPEDVWYHPVDRIAATHEHVVLARRIAEFLRDQLEAGTALPLPDGAPRAMTAGDVLILVQRRGTLFREIIRACKSAGLPIAGADRLKVMAELAVRDIVALLRFVATQEDDLSLATALRSPLFGLSEQQLFTLAHGRPEKAPLWQALRGARATHPEVLEVIDDLRGQADFLRPFDLIERILTRHRGRVRLLGRLGIEAEDGIDSLLAQALSYEQSEVPSLTGFLEWVQTDELEIKRSAEAAGARIRVMTVHGAKGLEAPVVILPDCAKRRNEVRSEVLPVADGVVWKRVKAERPALQQAAEDRIADAQARERDRLLYVAMTRAETWLIVAAAGDTGTGPGDSWYRQVEAGLARLEAAPLRVFGEDGVRLGGAWPDPVPPDATEGAARDPGPDLPDWAFRPAPGIAAPVLRTPSDLGGAKALSGDAGEESGAAKTRGTAMHRLLEVLPAVPEAERAEAALRLLAQDDEEARGLVDEALAVLAMPEAAGLFVPGTLAEVALTGEVAGIGPLTGAIDRLVIGPDRVLAVDFKTNRTVPDAPEGVPEGLLRQMGAYRAMLAALYPERRIETALLWTAMPSLMLLPESEVMAALQRAGAS